MEGVEFNEGTTTSFRSVQKTSGIAARLVAWGYAKDESEATKILLGIAVVLLVSAFCLAFYAFSQGSVALTETERIRLEASTPPPNPYGRN